VGTQIANRAKALSIKGKTLMIAVDHPVWKQELVANKSLVLEKLNRILDEEFGAKDSGPRIQEIFIVNPTTTKKAYPKR
jgi:hypothetical protein